jgi:hypothetical protein
MLIILRRYEFGSTLTRMPKPFQIEALGFQSMEFALGETGMAHEAAGGRNSRFDYKDR